MRKSRLRYILTWIALAVLLICGILLVAVLMEQYRSSLHPSPSSWSMSLVLISASGIFLFMLAVKKAHRLWIDEERSLKEHEAGKQRRFSIRKKEPFKGEPGPGFCLHRQKTGQAYSGKCIAWKRWGSNC